MVASSEIDKVYCLVRGGNPMQRILASVKERGLELREASKAKIIALSTGDLSQPGFGLNASTLAQMKKEVSLIVHIAWPVNFNIHLQSFEPHIAGLYNLLGFSLCVDRPQPAQFFFCSSISTAFNTPHPASIPDAPIEDLTRASSMGYAQSKLVGEHIVRNAARAGARSYVLRIGQIVGDAQNGVWNDNEFIPSMIRSALTLKALPALQEVSLSAPTALFVTFPFEKAGH
jgi:thioester reductase-like protein